MRNAKASFSFHSCQLSTSWERTIIIMAYCSVLGPPESFASCLSNFQLDELLVLQKSVERMNYMDIGQAESCPKPIQLETVRLDPDSPLPERMALMAAERGSDHHDTTGSSGPWHSSSSTYWPAEPKPSKLQTLFQISITALAFLSFGGYLLCLIVQAIKSKGTTYFHPVATATTTLTNGNMKRIKIYRRSKRSSNNLEQYHPLMLDYVSYMKAMRNPK